MCPVRGPEGIPSKMCSLSIDFLKTHRSVTNDRPIRCFRSQGVPKAANGCTTASSNRSENTQQNWFGKPEHGFKISVMWVLIVVKYGLLSRTISTLQCRDFYCRNYAKQIDFAGSFAIYVLTGVRNKFQGYEPAKIGVGPPRDAKSRDTLGRILVIFAAVCHRVYYRFTDSR